MTPTLLAIDDVLANDTSCRLPLLYEWFNNCHTVATDLQKAICFFKPACPQRDPAKSVCQDHEVFHLLATLQPKPTNDILHFTNSVHSTTTYSVHLITSNKADREKREDAGEK